MLSSKNKYRLTSVLVILAMMLSFANISPARAALPKVAVYGSDVPSWTVEVIAKLTATGAFQQVDNLSPLGCQSDPTPTLATLQQYSAVLVYSNCSFNTTVLLGNVLADYIDGGGVVVVSTFALWTENVLGIGGRFDSGGYLPVTQGSQNSGTRLFLVADLPADPLLAGVNSLDGGSSSYHNTPLMLVPGATLVAHWTNGQPLVAFKGNVVALNFFPPSNDSRSDFWNSATDGVRLMTNALNFNFVTNESPTANAGGPYSGDEGSAIAMSGATASDPDAGDTLTYTWTSYSSLCSFSNANELNPNLTCSDNGSFTVALEVSDGSETVSSDANVTVNNVDPSVTVNNATVTVDEGQTANNAGSYSDVPADTVSLSVDAGSLLDNGDGTWSWSFASTDGLNQSSLVTITAQDEDGGLSNVSFNLVVNNVDPSVTVNNGTVTVDEGQTASNTGSYSDVPADTVSLSADMGSLIDNGDGTWSWSFASTDGPDQSSLVTITAQDEDGGLSNVSFNLVVNNVAPALGAISVDQALVPVGTAINTSASFTDPGALDTHTAVWDWGDGSTSVGTISESGGNGTASGSHSYSTPGIYTLRLTVTDKDGAASNESVYEYVVVYDPYGGFVTGGGWINSPAGAYTADPALTGKASFGFVAKYKKGQSTPDGNTEFQFKAGNLNFKSISYQWLVVAGSKAQFKGEGTINGDGHYGFMLTARDGNPDKFRIKIWDMDNGDSIVYDNLMGGGDDADPTTSLGGGSIVIHK